MNKVRILLVDPHEIVREGIKSLLRTQSDMHVVGETGSAKSALTLAEALKPDLVLLDIAAPGFGGANWLMHLQAYSAKTRLLVFAMEEETRLANELLAAGAAGFLLKRAASDQLIGAIRRAAKGEPLSDPELAGLVTQPTPNVAVESSFPGKLSKREQEVVRLIANGYSNQEIAKELKVSIKTVENCKARSMQRLKLRSRLELVRLVQAQGQAEGRA